MRRLTAAQLKDFVGENRILVGTRERPGVMETPDGKIVKSFYRRKRLSTSTFIPKVKRFTTNSRKLLERDIPAPVVEDVIYCNEVPVHMIVYPRLEGEDLRHLCHIGETGQLGRLAGFLAHLHERGIYFRAIHLGNVLRREDDSFAVLDIADLATRSGPLGTFMRARNLAHLMNTEEDKGYFAGYGVHRFLEEYLRESGTTGWRRRLLEMRFLVSLDEDVKHSLGEQS